MLPTHRINSYIRTTYEYTWLDPSVPLVHGVAAPLKIVCCPQPSYYAVAPVSHVGALTTLATIWHFRKCGVLK